MTEEQSQSLLTFFQFALLNQAQAVSASQAAYQKIESLMARRSNEDFAPTFVRVTHEVLKQTKGGGLGSKSQSVLQGALTGFASGTDLSPWRDYYKNASSDEVSVVIWAHILKISIDDVAKGLDLTRGTLVHRLSRGVRQLAMKLEQNPTLQARRPWS